MSKLSGPILRFLQEAGRRGGKRGGKLRWKGISAEERSAQMKAVRAQGVKKAP